MNTSISREQFRNQVFQRDNFKCVICGSPAQDAHHIVERRLFPDGGYYLNNGASLCGVHHLQAESTELSCEQIREAAGITRVILPPQLDGLTIDKWGNPILTNGQRMRGELFEDESFRRIILPSVQFTSRIRYPRTYHLKWSGGISDTEEVIDETVFRNKRVVVTVKMDGENTTLTNEGVYARSPDSADHVSRHWIKNLHSRIAYQIPEGWRICGENLYAQHSIPYTNLKSYFQVFSVWDGMTCLSWDDTILYAEVLGLETVRVIENDLFDNIDFSGIHTDNEEGYVVRVAESFPYREFQRSVAKYVRPNHVQTHNQWKNRVVVNKLDSVW